MPKKEKPELIQYLKKDNIEVGIDEAGRGCLAGPVYIAACVWPQSEDPEIKNNKDIDIRDSKLLSKKRRAATFDYIKKTAIAYSIKHGDHNMIDKYNILKTTKLLMHEAVKDIEEQLQKKNIDIDAILVDGNQFDYYLDRNFEAIPHQCVTKGDNIYKSIAAASILAKETRDRYMIKLVEDNPEYKKYGWQDNMAYGTKKHIDAIKENGITSIHRKTFGICKTFA